jgi:hypothetical protein
MILNLTQHAATAEQLAAGVVDFDGATRAKLSALLTFDNLPTMVEVGEIADAIADLAIYEGENEDGVIPTRAMIGGAPFLMPTLEKVLIAVGITPCYAFSKRVVIKEADGVKERIVFKHEGFVWVDV